MNAAVRTLLNRHQATYQEVVKGDCYHVGTLQFAPQLAIDLGAHVGCFAALVLSRWPDCRVLAVEPGPANVASLRELAALLPGLTVLPAALGRGQARVRPYYDPDVTNGDVYWSQGCAEVCQEPDDWTAASEPTDVPCLTLSQIVASVPLPARYIVKLDCEGAECSLYSDPEAFRILRGAHYIAAELHLKGMRWDTIRCSDPLETVKQDSGRVLDKAEQWTQSFAATHRIEIWRGNRLWTFLATQREIDK